MEMEKLKSALKKIDEMIYMAKTDKSIDIKDLRKERQNTVRAIKALKNYTPQKDDVQSFSVYSYTVVTEDMPIYCHWSEGLNMVIKKNGVSIKLNGDELKQLVAYLPRTIGGSY